MKANIFFIGAFLGMFMIASCSNDDDENLVPKDDSRFWGYFKGTINGKEITLKNEGQEERPVQSSMMHILNYTPSEDDEIDSKREMKTVIGLYTGINYSENEGLGIYLFDLYTGKRYITNSTRVDFIYDGIQITRDTHSDKVEERYIRYIPKKEKPFRAEITNLIFADSTHPIIEVTLDGVLYRSDNHNDSIIVKGSYGTRYPIS